jgi:hypothetical protein
MTSREVADEQTTSLSRWEATNWWKKIIDAYTLDWEEERPNGGFVKIMYKHVQSLYTSRI